MNYEDKSDFEINKVVYVLEFGEWPKCDGNFIYHPTIIGEYNPCNNPRDAWSVMNNARIEIRRNACQAQISSYFNPEVVINCRNDEREILRATMICFLMMKDKQC